MQRGHCNAPGSEVPLGVREHVVLEVRARRGPEAHVSPEHLPARPGLHGLQGPAGAVVSPPAAQLLHLCLDVPGKLGQVLRPGGPQHLKLRHRPLNTKVSQIEARFIHFKCSLVTSLNRGISLFCVLSYPLTR